MYVHTTNHFLLLRRKKGTTDHCRGAFDCFLATLFRSCLLWAKRSKETPSLRWEDSIILTITIQFLQLAYNFCHLISRLVNDISCDGSQVFLLHLNIIVFFITVLFGTIMLRRHESHGHGHDMWLSLALLPPRAGEAGKPAIREGCVQLPKRAISMDGQYSRRAI